MDKSIVRQDINIKTINSLWENYFNNSPFLLIFISYGEF
jgi:hypothetical protein